MDEVFQLLDYLGIQSQSTIQTYARLAHRRHLKKGEHLYHGGEDSTNLYFLISGILRGFTVSAGGKEYTECILHKYGHAHIGMIGMGVEKEFKLNKNLEALTEVDVIYFDVRPIMKELPNSIEFLRVYVKKLEESYAQMWEAREIMRESAQARYTWFQKTYPNLQNVMQMKDVATFLGIMITANSMKPMVCIGNFCHSALKSRIHPFRNSWADQQTNLRKTNICSFSSKKRTCPS